MRKVTKAGHRAKPWVLGINASHNGAYCLLHGGEIRVAIQEERLTGLKRARVYGARRGLGLRYCLQAAGIGVHDLAMVVLSCQRSAQAEENDLRVHPDLVALDRTKLRVVPHHLAHAASAVAVSGFTSSAVMVVDGQGSPVEDLDDAARRVIVGPRESASEHLSLYSHDGTRLVPLEVHTAANWIERNGSGMARFFSLGGMYSAVAQQVFGDLMEAGKVMGLAPYGEPVIPVEEFLAVDGRGIEFTNQVQRRFRHDERWPSRRRAYEGLAASVQRALEVALMDAALRLQRTTNARQLCLAGGVALNSVANQRICREAGFDDVYIAPWAEDSGAALGAAYLGLWALGIKAAPAVLKRDSLGRTGTEAEVEAAIQMTPGIVAARPRDLLGEISGRLRDGEIGGWYQGGCELGPRALGQRSVLCSPCGKDAKAKLNARVKFREAFRPFAPAVLAGHAGEWFDYGGSPVESPFMLRVVPFREEVRRRVPAVVHVDGTGRVQTVTAAENGAFHELVARFHDLTGVPMLLNTSLNIHGEPIVETPRDALWCLLGTGMDFCVVHDWLVTKSEGFGSILDYVPAVVASEYTLRMDVAKYALQSSVTREDAVTVRVNTQWGWSDLLLPPRLLPLLARVDGRRSGHELVASFGEGATAESVTRDLLLLRRMHVIELLSFHVQQH